MFTVNYETTCITVALLWQTLLASIFSTSLKIGFKLYTRSSQFCIKTQHSQVFLFSSCYLGRSNISY